MVRTYNHFGAPILMGCGAVKLAGEKVKELGCNKVLIVHDKNLREIGLLAKVTDSLDAAGVAYICFDGVLPDPPDYTVEECAKLARDEKIDGIIGFGGGSAIDTAKAVNVLINNPSPIQNYFKPGMVLKPGVPKVYIPTTAGTGSEVTTMAVVTDTSDKNAKRAISNPAVCLATLALVDPELMMGMPPALTASTGMDAFSHAAEAITSAPACPVTDALAREAMRMIAKYLPIAVADGKNVEAREAMANASTIAGMAFTNARVHIGHAIAHELGSAYHIPHGVACAIALAPVIHGVSKYVPEKVRMIGECIGCDIPADASVQQIGDTVYQALLALAKKVGIKNMKELGFDRETVRGLADRVKLQGAYLARPADITDAELDQILCEAYDA